MKKSLITICILHFAICNLHSLPAFPGAQGFGANTPGGRGGQVIHVTNLNATGPGSLAEACAASGPRIVVFDTSGVIEGNVVIRNPFITVAGQTALGAGITVYGSFKAPYNSGVKPSPIHDVIVRFIRVRAKQLAGEYDCYNMYNVYNSIHDHITCSWANDEVFDAIHAANITVQWSAVEESDATGHPKGQHNFGMIFGYSGDSLTMHHNLIAHHMRRAPLIGGPMFTDHRYNVMYNMHGGIYWHPNTGAPANIINNYFKEGPNSDYASGGGSLETCVIGADTTVRLYASNNYFDWLGGIQDPWQAVASHPELLSGPPHKMDVPYEAVPVDSHTAEEAYDVVLKHAGCLPRDTVGRRTVQEVKDKTGTWGRREPVDLMAGLSPVSRGTDTDNDGMPDNWETARGLNPNDPADRNGTDLSPGGYTNIEMYINELADGLIVAHGGEPFMEIQKSRFNSQAKVSYFFEVCPNPFNIATKIAISHPALAGSAISKAKLDIFDINGKIVKRLTVPPGRDRQLIAGIPWNASQHPSGIYIAKLNLGKKTVSKKLILLK